MWRRNGYRSSGCRASDDHLERARQVEDLQKRREDDVDMMAMVVRFGVLCVKGKGIGQRQEDAFGDADTKGVLFGHGTMLELL